VAYPSSLSLGNRPGTPCTGDWVASGSGWIVPEYLAPSGVPSPERPTRNLSLYRLSYPGRTLTFAYFYYFCRDVFCVFSKIVYIVPFVETLKISLTIFSTLQYIILHFLSLNVLCKKWQPEDTVVLSPFPYASSLFSDFHFYHLCNISTVIFSNCVNSSILLDIQGRTATPKLWAVLNRSGSAGSPRDSTR
jgi:hypothetical protein